MDKSMYKQLVAEYMRKNAKLEKQNLELEQKTQDYYFDIRNKNLEIHMLKEENTKLRIALCNLRDEYLDMGGDPKQLELFDKDDSSQLKLDFEIEKTSNNDFQVKRPMIYESPDGGKTIYGRRAGDKVREQFNRECD